MADEERYLEWLERLEVPIEATTDIETFQSWLKEQVSDKAYEYGKDLAWEAIQERVVPLAEAGIRGVRIEYPWGVEIRYGIQGMPGLWGWESVKTIMEAEEWW